MSAEPFDRAAAGREAVNRRWARYRAERIAQGLPPTKREERGSRNEFLTQDIEPYWLERAAGLGLLQDAHTSTQRRLLAARLARSGDAELQRRIDEGEPAQPLGNEDAVLQFHLDEAARYEHLAEKADQRADQYRIRARGSEMAYVEALRKAGRA